MTFSAETIGERVGLKRVLFRETFFFNNSKSNSFKSIFSDKCVQKDNVSLKILIPRVFF